MGSDSKILIQIIKIKRNSNGVILGEGIVVNELTTKKKVKFASRSSYAPFAFGEWAESIAKGVYPEYMMDTFYITEVV